MDLRNYSFPLLKRHMAKATLISFCCSFVFVWILYITELGFTSTQCFCYLFGYPLLYFKSKWNFYCLKHWSHKDLSLWREMLKPYYTSSALSDMKEKDFQNCFPFNQCLYSERRKEVGALFLIPSVSQAWKGFWVHFRELRFWESTENTLNSVRTM